MCCRRNQPQYLLQTRQLPKCAARRQERRELRALAVNSLPILEIENELGPRQALQPHWTEYQPRTMAGILVMGVALGLQEGGKKIKEKRDERKAKKAALVGCEFIEYLHSSNNCVTGNRSTCTSRILFLWSGARQLHAQGIEAREKERGSTGRATAPQLQLRESP